LDDEESNNPTALCGVDEAHELERSMQFRAVRVGLLLTSSGNSARV
jgi:hypothetical protein